MARSSSKPIDLHDIYLNDKIVATLNIRDQVTHHEYCMDYWKYQDKDLYRYHRDELRKLDNSPLLYSI